MSNSQKKLKWQINNIRRFNPTNNETLQKLKKVRFGVIRLAKIKTMANIQFW